MKPLIDMDRPAKEGWTMNLYATLLTIVGVLLLSTSATADDASGSFRVSVVVPEYCEISTSDVLAPAGNGYVTGSVFESCNVQTGFQVTASHRPLEQNERATFTYAQEVRRLHSSGWSMVANRIGANFGSRPISVQYSALSAPLAISLTITTF